MDWGRPSPIRGARGATRSTYLSCDNTIDAKLLLLALQKPVLVLEDDLRAKEADRIMAGQNHEHGHSSHLFAATD